MKLSHYDLDSPLTFDGQSINVLVIENQKLMTHFIKDLISQSNGMGGGFVLSEKNESLSAAGKVVVITEPFSLNMNERNILNRVYIQMKHDALDEELYMATNSILSEIEKHVDRLLLNQSVPMESNPPDILNLIKLMNIQFTIPETMLELLCDYLDICSEHLMTKLFVFVNLKSFVDEQELKDLYNHILYRKYNVLMIENKQYRTLDHEIIRIIDKDACEFQISGADDIY